MEHKDSPQAHKDEDEQNTREDRGHIFLNFQGLIDIEWIPVGQTINKEYNTVKVMVKTRVDRWWLHVSSSGTVFHATSRYW